MPEGNGEHLVEFPVHLSVPAATRVVARCMPNDGTAHIGVDYAGSSGVAAFEPGQTEAVCAIRVLGNALPEPDKTFTVTVEPFIGALSVSKGTALCTLVNDDAGRHRATR